MQTLVIDTNGIVKKLEQRGFSRTQAEGITEALKELDTSALHIYMSGLGACALAGRTELLLMEGFFRHPNGEIMQSCDNILSAREAMMRCIAIGVSLCVFSASALADASCTTKGAEKKLAGAALTSFMTKCEQDAAAACNADGKSQKLAGAALDSHMKKCIAAAVGDKASLTCKGQAGEKKLAGAALNSFMNKCEQDAAAACDADGKSQKIAGAALDSHMKKCIADAVGAK